MRSVCAAYAPAVIRLEILQEEPLKFTQTPFVAASPANGPANVGGGQFPNGIRFHGDTMYLVRGPDIVAVPVGLDRPDAPLETAYKPADDLSFIDDFDIVDLSGIQLLEELGIRYLAPPTAAGIGNQHEDKKHQDRWQRCQNDSSEQRPRTALPARSAATIW